MTDDLDATALQDAVYMADIDDPDYTPPADDDKGDDKDDSQNDGDDDGKDAGTDDKADDDNKADDKKDDKPDKLSELETKLTEAQKEINRLGYALRKGEKKETTDDKETPFTKAQLMQLYKEHSDDPEVVFQIMKEMQKQGKVDATAAAEKSVDIKNKKGQMDTFMEGIYPDAKKEGSSLHAGIQEAIEWAHLEGHPFAEHLALGLLTVKNLPETIKKIKDDAKAEYGKASEEDLKKKAEDARKKNIAANKTGKTGKSSDATKTIQLTPEQLDSAKRLGLTSKVQLARYAKILGVKGETVHSEA